MFSRCSIYVVTSVDMGDESRSPQTQRSKLSGIAQLQKALSHRCGYGFPGLCRVGVLRKRVAASVLLIIAEQRTSECIYLEAGGGGICTVTYHYSFYKKQSVYGCTKVGMSQKYVE